MRDISLVWTSETIVGDPERKVTVVAFMPETGARAHWQSPSAYSHLLKMDMAGLAWEWLRRTKHYHLIYGSQTNRGQKHLADDLFSLPALDAPAAASAGLHFL